ncbi:MAG: hypothetical protein U0U66_09075 [Cytophagaceae bacterium]
MSLVKKISSLSLLGKIGLTVTVSISLLLGLGYFYLKTNARELILDYANEKTQGKYQINLKQVHLNIWERNLKIKNFTLQEIQVDTSKSNIEYIHIPDIDVQISSLLSLFYKRILIEHVITTKPELIYRIRKHNHIDSTGMTRTFGKIFLSLESILEELNVGKIAIEDASLSLRFIGRNSTIIEPFPNLNLTISDFNLNNSSSTLLHSSDIRFNTKNLQYVLPDSSTTIQLSSIDISTGEKYIAVKNVHFVHINPNATINKLELLIPDIRFRNTDFYQLYNYNKIVADSIILSDAQVDVGFKKSFNEEKTSKVNIEKQLKESLHACDVKYIGLLNSKINLDTDFQELLNNIQVSKNDIEIWNLKKSPGKMYSLDSILIKVDNYKRYSEDSLYVATLGSVTINKDKFILNDYNLQPSHNLKNKNGIYLETKKLIINQPDYYSVIANATANVDDIELYEPKIKYIHNISSHHDKDKRSNKDKVQGVWSRVNLNYLKISNGNISYESNIKNSKIDFSNVNTRVDFKYISDTISILSILHNCQYFNLKKINYQDKHRLLKSGYISYEKNKRDLIFNELYYLDSSGIYDIKKLDLKRLRLSEDKIECGKISWQEATVTVTPHRHSHPNHPSNKRFYPPLLQVDSVWGYNTKFHYLQTSKEKEVTGNIQSVFASNFNFNKQVSWDNLILDMRDLSVKTNDIRLTAPSVYISEHSISKISKPILNVKNYEHEISTQIDSICLNLSLNELLNHNKLSSNSLLIHNPKIKLHQLHPPYANQNSKNKSPFSFDLKNIQINNGRIDYNSTIPNNTRKITMDSLQFKLASLQKDSIAFKSENIDLSTDIKNLSLKDSIFITTRKKINISIKSISQDENQNLQLYLKQLYIPIQNIKVLLKKDSKIDLSKFDIELKNHHFNFAHRLNIMDFIKSKPDLEIRKVNTQLDTKDGLFKFHNISLSLLSEQITLDSISYKPKYALDEFNDLYGIQKDYIQLHIGKISLTGIKIHHYLDDQDIFAKKLTVWDASISSTRDKSLQDPPVIEKSLLFGMVKKIPIPLFIEEVSLVNARASYTEYSTNHKHGTITFDKIQCSIKPLTNTTEHTDTMVLSCKALLLNKTPLHLIYRESLRDTASGFKYRLHLGKMNMTHLNEVVTPLSNIVIKSGMIDTLIIRSAGNNTLCYGTINFYFRNLKININANSDESIINPLLDIASLYANVLILRSKNTDKMDRVYFERIPHKSIFNYWFKITLSGVMTGIGLKHDKVYQKKYEQYLNSQSIN